MSQEEKKLDFSNLPRGAIGLKGLPVNRNARLPSIRTPRDLTLGSQPKRTFLPNIPVRREKKNSSQENPEDGSNKVRKESFLPSKADKGRGRGRGPKSFIQTEGSIFGEGASVPVEPRKEKMRESLPKMGSSSRSSGAVKKEKLDVDISGMSSSMDNLLRDDFIDDGDSEKESQKPIIFPVTDNAKKEEFQETSVDTELFKNTNLAQEMGFDIEKIQKFIKKEKSDKDKPPSLKAIKKDLPRNEISKLLTCDKSQLLLLQFPKCVASHHVDYHHKSSSSQDGFSGADTEKSSSKSLSSLPEGQVGKLQILKSGQARIVFGDLVFDLDSLNPLHSHHEAVSIQTDLDSNNLAVLGKLQHKLSFAPSIDSLLR